VTAVAQGCVYGGCLFVFLRGGCALACIDIFAAFFILALLDGLLENKSNYCL
jgi:hypothetical protein